MRCMISKKTFSKIKFYFSKIYFKLVISLLTNPKKYIAHLLGRKLEGKMSKNCQIHFFLVIIKYILGPYFITTIDSDLMEKNNENLVCLNGTFL